MDRGQSLSLPAFLIGRVKGEKKQRDFDFALTGKQFVASSYALFGHWG